MGFELDSRRAVLNSYGVRTTNSAFGANLGNDAVKYVSIEVTSPASGAGTFENGISNAAWARNGLDVVIPAGAIFLSADLVVETAFNTLTALTIGTYLASNGTTAVLVEGLVTAAGSPLTAIDAVGDRLVGTGAHLATATGAGAANTAAVVIRVLYTGTAPTLGKARVMVRYLNKAA